MARIRTIKPEFFRDEELQDLEAAHPGKHCMLVFAGLWGHCDKAGRFEWKPRQLKLDILPFLAFEMGETLAALVAGGFVTLYEVDGRAYGEIPTFAKHQRLNGKEQQEPEKHPPPPGKQQGSAGEAPGKQQGSTFPDRNGVWRRENGEGGEASGASRAVPRKRGSPLPSDFQPSPAVKSWAREQGFESTLDAHLAYLRDWAAATGAVRRDWDATLRNAIRADWGNIRRAAGVKTAAVGPIPAAQRDAAGVIAESRAARAGAVPMPDHLRRRASA